MSKKWFLIVNPHAGSDKGIRVWDHIERKLMEADVDFSYLFTGKRLDAERIARKAVEEGWRNIAAVGGDGTVNETVNGIFNQKAVSVDEVRLGLIQVGTGNDWAKSVNLTGGEKSNIDVLLSGNEIVQDIGYVEYTENRARKSRYFVNISGFGFDAAVALKTNDVKDRGRGGRLSYIRSLLSVMLCYKSTAAEISIDGKTKKANLFSLAIGVGKYNGNGMKQLPDAIIDDGFLAYVIFDDLKMIEVAANIKKLYKGRLEGHPKISYGRCRTLEIKGASSVRGECDGEIIGKGPYKIGLIPRSLRVAVP